MSFAGQLHTPVQSEKKRHEQHDGVVQRAVNSGMGFIVGDILAQRLTGEAFDAVRSLELGLYGTLLGMSSCISRLKGLQLLDCVFSVIQARFAKLKLWGVSTCCPALPLQSLALLRMLMLAMPSLSCPCPVIAFSPSSSQIMVDAVLSHVMVDSILRF